MSDTQIDEAREHRIAMEAVVDTYSEDERAMGWYYYLEDKLKFPFQAKCVAERRISPLSEGEEVMVVGMAPEDECMREVFIEIQWLEKVLAVPLAQLEAIGVDHATQEGIEDWRYWVAMGYQY